MKNKPTLNFWQIWNMSFGFLGIQLGFALQGGFMSRVFQTLGASVDQIPLLWIAGPVTGLLVQPIIGYFSDKTWHPRLGRRRPYFLIGAILSSLALFVMPYSPALWVAASLLWIMDASFNISMEPFRALVADKLNEQQRSYGFIVQTLVIGVGTMVGSALPFIIAKMGVSNTAAQGVIPLSVKIAFAIGAAIFILSILYTVYKTPEYPPSDEELNEIKNAGFFKGIKEIFDNIAQMPSTMIKLGVVQFFSWFAFFTMWSFATPAITKHVFNATDATSQAYQNGADWVGICMSFYGFVSMIYALLMAFYSSKIRINRKWFHLVNLVIGGLGFISIYYVTNQYMLLACFAGIGIAWTSILSMPYAMLSSSINPKKMGVYMGIFNMFIVLPQIVASLGGANFAYKTFFGADVINTMLLAGTCLILAGLSNLLITNPKAIK